MSQLIGGRYVLRHGVRVLVADEFDQPVGAAEASAVVATAALVAAEPIETEAPADAGQQED